MLERRPWSHRLVWNPLLPAALLAYFVLRISRSGFSTMLIFGLVTVGLWFVLAVLAWLRGHRSGG